MGENKMDLITIFYIIALFGGGAFTLVKFFILCDDVRKTAKYLREILDDVKKKD
jgi:hypothetical protein